MTGLPADETRSPGPPSLAVGDDRTATGPWLPLIIIVLAQLQMAINISALPVSLGPMSEDLDAPSTASATALLIYSLFVATFVMVGAKVGKLLGERRVVAGIALLSIFPANRLPTYTPGELSADDIVSELRPPGRRQTVPR